MQHDTNTNTVALTTVDANYAVLDEVMRFAPLWVGLLDDAPAKRKAWMNAIHERLMHVVMRARWEIERQVYGFPLTREVFAAVLDAFNDAIAIELALDGLHPESAGFDGEPRNLVQLTRKVLSDSKPYFRATIAEFLETNGAERQ